MIQTKCYKTIRVIVDSGGGDTPFYIENIDSGTGYFSLYRENSPMYTINLTYKIDNGEWFEYDTSNSAIIEVPTGSKIYLKGDNPDGFNQMTHECYKLCLSSTSDDPFSYSLCNIGGYLTSLIASENFNLINHIPDSCFAGLFKENMGLVSAENLITSNIISVGSNGFNNCFQGCTSLVIPPTFENVTSVDVYGFESCFSGCDVLVTTPKFDKITSVEMFAFDWCFMYCTSVETIYAPSPSTWDTSQFENWVSNVNSTGTFYKKKGLEIPSGESGIPEGWTVVEVD